MEISSTNKSLLKILLLFVVITSAAIFLGAAKSPQFQSSSDNDTTNIHNTDGEEIFTFYENEHADKVKFEVHFNDGEITSLFRNGNKIPQDEYDEYEDLIHNRLSDLTFRPKVFAFNLDDMDWDHEKFKDDMDKLREDLKEQKFEWHNFDFDKEELNENMEELKENLKDMKLHQFHFKYDGSELRDQLESLEKELRKLKDDSMNIELNLDHLRDNLDKLIDKLDEDRVVIGNFDNHIEVFADKNAKTKHHLKIFRNKTEDSDEFIEKLKDELVNDKIISDRDDFESFELTDNKLLVNDEKQSDELYNKYKKFYKENTDNDLEGKFKIKIRE